MAAIKKTNVDYTAKDMRVCKYDDVIDKLIIKKGKTFRPLDDPGAEYWVCMNGPRVRWHETEPRKKPLAPGYVYMENPPVAVSKLLLKIDRGEGNTTFILPNRHLFTIPNSAYDDLPNHVIFYLPDDRNYSELAGRIRKGDFYLNNEKARGVVNITPTHVAVVDKKTTKYSDHVDFDPEKRIAVHVDQALKSLATSEKHGGLGEDSIGSIRIVKNFVFLPSNCITIRFSKTTFKNNQIGNNLFVRMQSSFMGQTMTAATTARTAARLATVQMFYMKCPMTFEHKIGLFSILFDKNLTVLTDGKRVNFSRSDVWNVLSDIPSVYIPIDPIGRKVRPIAIFAESTIAKENADFKLIVDETYMLGLFQKHFAHLDPDKMDIEEILENYRSGVFNLFAQDIEPFLFKNPTKSEFIGVAYDGHYSSEVLFLKKIVELRFMEVDIMKVLEKALEYLASLQDLELLRRVVKKLSKFYFCNLHASGIYNLIEVVPKPIPVCTADNQYSKITWINEHVKNEKKIAILAQAEFNLWSKIFGFTLHANVFNHPDYILELAYSRRITQCGADDSDDDEGFLAKTASYIRAPFEKGKNFIDNMSNLASSLANPQELIDKFSKEMENRFDKLGMKNTVAAFKNFRFDSITDVIHSSKDLVNMWFTDVVGKVCSIFGIEYEHKIDASQLVFYYLVWVKTDNMMIKYYILLDILGTLGILDLFLTICRKVFNLIRGAFSKPTGAEFDEFLKSIDDTSAKLEAEPKKKIEDFPALEEETDTTGWLATLMQHFEYATPIMLGVAAAAGLAHFGFQATDSHATLGKRVVQGARNFGFLALGVSAFPKIFQNVISVVHYVYDHIRGVVCKDHIVLADKMRRVSDWLTSTILVEGQTEACLVNDLSYCFKMLQKQVEMVEIATFINDIPDPSMKIAFRTREAQMNKISTILHSAINMIIGQREIFHVQITSTPGLGKTDLASQTLASLQNVFAEQNKKIAAQHGLKAAPTASGGIYSMNDCLSFSDMYYDQGFGYTDDANVFKDGNREVVTQKLQMLSGQTALTNQASLADKGRVYTFQAVVSNTNNPFAKMDGMFTNEALWRRRVLFRARVKESCATNGKPDDTKINALGYNRTKGEHLLITWLDEVNENMVTKHEQAHEMEVVDYLRLVQTLARKHIATEEKRLFEKNPLSATLRVHYTNLYNDLKVSLKKVVDQNSTLSPIKKLLAAMAAHRTEISKKKFKVPEGLEVTQEQIKCAKLVFEAIQEEATTSLDRTITDLDAIEPYTGPEIEREIKEFNQKLTPVPVTFIDEAELMNYRVVQGDGYYHLEPCMKPFLSFEGPIDWTKIKLSTINGNRRPVYTGEGRNPHILYALMLAASSDNEDDFKLLCGRKVAEAERTKKVEKWHAKYTSALKSAASTAGSFLKHIARKTVEIMGEALVSGIAVALSILMAFFGLMMIGKFFAPEQMSYNQRIDKKSTIRQTAGVGADDDMYQLAKKATYKVRFTANSRTRYGTLIGIQGTIFLGNWHVLNGITQTTTLYIYDPCRDAGNPEDAVRAVEVTPGDIRKLKDCDAALIDLRSVRPTKNVIQHFVSERDCESDLETLRQAYLTGIVLRETQTPFLDDWKRSNRRFATTGSAMGKLYDYNATKPNDKHEFVMSFMCENPVVPGDSGSLVIHDEHRAAGQFLGIVIAGQEHTSQTFCGVITKEQLQREIKAFPVQSRMQTQQVATTQLSAEHPLHSVFTYPEDAFHSVYPNQDISHTSGFKRSKIFGVFPNESTPAIQTQADPRIPLGARHHLQVSLNKSIGVHLPEFSLEEEAWMKRALTDMYLTSIPNITEIKVYNTKQAITGIRMKGSTSINTKTSPGLPYKLEKGVSGKRPFIGYDLRTNSWQISERVIHDVAYYREHYENACVPLNCKLEFQKKELVSENKILEPKTRTVATGNMIHQILYNECFKDLMTFTKTTWDRGATIPFALGVDPERHWHLVAKHLRYHDNIIDLDVKAWESKISLRTLLMTTSVKLDLLRRAYQSRGQKCPNIEAVAYGLAVDYMDSEVAFKDVVYRKREGLLSGHPGTFIENSEIHYMFIMLICKRILESKNKPQWATAAFLREHVRVIMAADDILIAPSPLVARLINAETIVAGYNHLSFSVTAPDKSNNIKAAHLTEVAFLKMKFRQLDGIYYPCPNLSIIHQLFNWIRDDTELSPEDQFQVNLENAFRFAWWRGESEYEEIRFMVNQALLPFNMTWGYSHEEMAVLVGREIDKNTERAQRETPAHDQEDVGLF